MGRRPGGLLARGLLVLAGLALGLAASTLLLLAWFRYHGAPLGNPLDLVTLKNRLTHNNLSNFMFDPDLGYRFKPSFRGVRSFSRALPHRTNSLGLLGEEEPPADPSVRKVLFLGDSVTYGVDVPVGETFVSRMQERAGASFRLLNGGVPGWTTYQELLFLEKFLGGTDWSLVVVVFALNDTMKFEFHFDPKEERIYASPEFLDMMKFAGRAAKLAAIQMRFALSEDTEPLARQDVNFIAAWDPDNWERFAVNVMGPLPPDRSRRPLVFVAVPTPDQLEAAARNAPRATVFYPQMRLAEFCGERGIPFVDARGAFPAGVPPSSFFQDYCHPNERGHEALAAYLWPRLAEILRGAGA